MTTLITSETCAPCKIVKQKIAENNWEVEILDLNTVEGVNKARQHSIRNVPTLITDEGSIIVGAENILKELEGK
jgi:glutaredoxin